MESFAGRDRGFDFLSAVKALKPTAIIGVAAVGGTFTPEVLRAMTDCNVRPIVFALAAVAAAIGCQLPDSAWPAIGRCTPASRSIRKYS